MAATERRTVDGAENSVGEDPGRYFEVGLTVMRQVMERSVMLVRE